MLHSCVAFLTLQAFLFIGNNPQAGGARRMKRCETAVSLVPSSFLLHTFVAVLPLTSTKQDKKPLKQSNLLFFSSPFSFTCQTPLLPEQRSPWHGVREGYSEPVHFLLLGTAQLWALVVGAGGGWFQQGKRSTHLHRLLLPATSLLSDKHGFILALAFWSRINFPLNRSAWDGARIHGLP